MRHVPTALYIDTEPFKRNGLRLDTREFSLLTNTFVKGGIRLLIPEMMERELRRHYERQATKCGDQWRALQSEHPLQLLTWSTLRSAEDISAECLSELNARWDQFKSHFTVEQLPLVGDLKAVVNQYFATGAPFSAGKPKEFPDAFILSALDGYHNAHKVNIAVVSSDGDFRKACALRSFLRHFTSVEAYVDAFKPELSRQDYEIEEPVDPLLPIVTEDLTELKGLLRRGSEVTKIEGDRLIALLRSRGENYRYFFLNAAEPSWIPRLEAAGLFTNVPDIEQLPDGSTKIPDWPPIHYLDRMFEDNPETVVRIIESLPETSNPRVLDHVVSIASKCDRPELVLRMAKKILASADNPRPARDKFVALLRRLAQW